jgi:hypothetical protein
MANVRINKTTGNLEIVYQRKPAQATRDTLRTAGFKWRERDQCWWGSATNDRVAVAMRVDPDFRPVARRPGKSMKGVLPAKAAKANGAKRAPGDLPPLAEWDTSAGGTGAARGKSGYSTLPPGLEHYQRVTIQPISDRRGYHLGYAVGSFGWKYPGHEVITPAGELRPFNGVSQEDLVRSPQAGVTAARKAFVSLRGAKPNDMAEDFARQVPRLSASRVAGANVWNTVGLEDEVEFRPFGAGLPVRGWVRKVTHAEEGVVVKLRGTKVLINGRWMTGSSTLDAQPRTLGTGTLVLLEKATPFKHNGNLEEELRDRRRASRTAVPAKKGGKPTTPAKRKASRPAPANYRVSGDGAADLTFFDAMKRARAIAAEVGDKARRYNHGSLYVYNRNTKAEVGLWKVGADGRFHPVKK